MTQDPTRRMLLVGRSMAATLAGKGSFFGSWSQNRAFAQTKPNKLGLTCDATGQYSFLKLRAKGNLEFVCLDATGDYHLDILQEIADRFVLVHGGCATRKPKLAELAAEKRVRGHLCPEMRQDGEARA